MIYEIIINVHSVVCDPLLLQEVH